MSRTGPFKPDDAHSLIKDLERRISVMERVQRSNHANIASASVAASDTITTTKLRRPRARRPGRCFPGVGDRSRAYLRRRAVRRL